MTTVGGSRTSALPGGSRYPSTYVVLVSGQRMERPSRTMSLTVVRPGISRWDLPVGDPLTSTRDATRWVISSVSGRPAKLPSARRAHWVRLRFEVAVFMPMPPCGRRRFFCAPLLPGLLLAAGLLPRAASRSGLLCSLSRSRSACAPPLSLLSSWAVRGPTCGPHVDLGASYLSRTLPVLSPSLDFFVTYVQGFASS